MKKRALLLLLIFRTGTARINGVREKGAAARVHLRGCERDNTIYLQGFQTTCAIEKREMIRCIIARAKITKNDATSRRVRIACSVLVSCESKGSLFSILSSRCSSFFFFWFSFFDKSFAKIYERDTSIRRKLPSRGAYQAFDFVQESGGNEGDVSARGWRVYVECLLERVCATS